MGPRVSPKWSLHQVLAYLAAQVGSDTEDLLLQSSVFVLALATGFRASQLAAPTRYPSFTTFGEDVSALTLALSPKFLAKNEQVDNLMAPFRDPSLRQGARHLSLYPVSATKAYLDVAQTLPKTASSTMPRRTNPLVREP
ncbi:hypothetical protein Pcinc_014117 [Petrolisthes cinctipes]|uniref:Uncharacterized protein n=1 Tax=Petrolisthes cinctipes TaxID=88211 RepID=A0AAE1FXP1_PETCI|nr:hypothetical protein Pcinc_014117 [Petrolisthes cinctipes]